VSRSRSPVPTPPLVRDGPEQDRTPSDVARLRARVGELMPQTREELAELVAIPSVADPRLFPSSECVR
jgi:hypothetical protein